MYNEEQQNMTRMFEEAFNGTNNIIENNLETNSNNILKLFESVETSLKSRGIIS